MAHEKDSCNFQVSIVVPVHRAGSYLETCLQSISDHANDVFELIVVLDGVEIDLAYFQRFELPKLYLESISENRGPAYARNRGAKLASGDILFFIDSDVCIKHDTIDRLKRNFKNETAPDAVIGSYDDSPGDQSVVSKFRNLLHHHTHQNARIEASTFWGACGAIKKEVFWQVNGFNEDFSQPSVEDIDLGYRLSQNGLRIRLDKKLQIKHLKKWTLQNMIKTDVFYRAKPWTLLLHKYKKSDFKDLNLKSEERIAASLLGLGIFLMLSLVVSIYVTPLVITCFLLLLILKRSTYVFFAQYFKFSQMPIIILLHWSYLLSAILGYVLGVKSVFLQKIFKKRS